MTVATVMAPDSSTWFLQSMSSVFGWIYFLSWSISFYPQPLLNWRRRSTTGLLIDFPFANIFGFLFYTLSTTMLYYSTVVREEYARRNPRAPVPTVQFNDVAFAVHALLICIVALSMFSERIWGFSQSGSNSSSSSRIRLPTRPILGLTLGCLVAALWTAYKAASDSSWAWLDVTYALGYGKLVITVAKYVPQAIANYRRKSTVGWSIGQVLLDFLGGILSIAQLLIDSSLQGDWSGVTGNPVKFGLGNVSILFDIVYMTQHYLLYPSPHTSPSSSTASLEGGVDERESLIGRSQNRNRLD